MSDLLPHQIDVLQFHGRGPVTFTVEWKDGPTTFDFLTDALDFLSETQPKGFDLWYLDRHGERHQLIHRLDRCKFWENVP